LTSSIFLVDEGLSKVPRSALQFSVLRSASRYISRMNLIWEPILAIILAISSFSIKSNPKGPGADVVLEHAVDEADVVMHVDWKATVGDNYGIFQKLVDDPRAKSVPELSTALRDGLTQAEGGRAMFKNMVGFDLVNDLTSVTAFLKMPAPGAQPEFLVVVRGNLAADLPSKIARSMGGKEETIDGRVAAAMPDGTLIGFSKSGALLAGQRDWVAPRLANGWKVASRSKGSAWSYIGAALDRKPFYLLASKPSLEAVSRMTAQIGTDSFGKDLISNHTLAIVSLTSTGLHWIYQAKDVAFAARIKQASEGVIELMRAGHLFPRGIAELTAAALPSYAGKSPAIDGAIKHRAALMAAVDDLTGDGKFTATVKQSGNLVSVETKGKRLSDVVPTGVLVGFGAIGFMTMRTSVSAPPPATVGPGPGRSPAKPIKPAPAEKPGLGAPIKRP